MELYLWDIDVADDQELYYIFEAHKPDTCLDKVSRLPGTLEFVTTKPKSYDFYAHWHEAEDSWIYRVKEKENTDIELLFETLNDAMIRIEELEEKGQQQ
jgi:hypothetical protein